MFISYAQNFADGILNRALKSTAQLLRQFRSRLIFHAKGRPRRLARVALFHRDGEARRFFRRIVFSKRGRARPSFRLWIEGNSPWAGADVSPPEPLSDRVAAALSVLVAARQAQRLGLSR